jgi:hypothetical protein
MIETYWHHTRLPGRVKLSMRQRLLGGDSGTPHVLVEDIVLESLDPLQVQDQGTEHEYPQLRRRR